MTVLDCLRCFCILVSLYPCILMFSRASLLLSSVFYLLSRICPCICKQLGYYDNISHALVKYTREISLDGRHNSRTGSNSQFPIPNSQIHKTQNPNPSFVGRCEFLPSFLRFPVSYVSYVLASVGLLCFESVFVSCVAYQLEVRMRRTIQRHNDTTIRRRRSPRDVLGWENGLWCELDPVQTRQSSKVWWEVWRFEGWRCEARSLKLDIWSWKVKGLALA
jgi:hypothetical protein